MTTGSLLELHAVIHDPHTACIRDVTLALRWALRMRVLIELMLRQVSATISRFVLTCVLSAMISTSRSVSLRCDRASCSSSCFFLRASLDAPVPALGHARRDVRGEVDAVDEDPTAGWLPHGAGPVHCNDARWTRPQSDVMCRCSLAGVEGAADDGGMTTIPPHRRPLFTPVSS